MRTMADSEKKITPEQRAVFLRDQGWSEDLEQTTKDQIEASWSDENIEMATKLGFA